MIHVVSADVTFRFIVRVNAACEIFTAHFRAAGWQCRKLGVKVVDVLTRACAALAATTGVVEAHYVNDIRYTSTPGSVHRDSHGASWIETFRQTLHRGDDSRAALSALLALFIAQRPDNHAGMISIAANQSFELAQAFRVRRHHPRLVHHEHAEAIARVREFGRWRIMR